MGQRGMGSAQAKATDVIVEGAGMEIGLVDMGSSTETGSSGDTENTHVRRRRPM